MWFRSISCQPYRFLGLQSTLLLLRHLCCRSKSPAGKCVPFGGAFMNLQRNTSWHVQSQPRKMHENASWPCYTWKECVEHGKALERMKRIHVRIDISKSKVTWSCWPLRRRHGANCQQSKKTFGRCGGNGEDSVFTWLAASLTTNQPYYFGDCWRILDCEAFFTQLILFHDDIEDVQHVSIYNYKWCIGTGCTALKPLLQASSRVHQRSFRKSNSFLGIKEKRMGPEIFVNVIWW